MTPGQILLYPILGQNPGATVVVNGVTYQTAALATDDDYWGAQPPAVVAARASMEVTPSTQLAAAAVCSDLAAAGYVIDPSIMYFGWDPMLTMWQRVGAGLSEVPDWTGAKQIAVSVLKSSYPLFTQPTPATPAASQVLVGAILPAQTQAAGKNVYGPGNVSVYNVTNGQQSIAPDGTPVHAVITQGLMGASLEWVAN